LREPIRPETYPERVRESGRTLLERLQGVALQVINDGTGVNQAQNRTALLSCLFGVPTLLCLWLYTLFYRQENVLLMYLPLALTAIMIGAVLQHLSGRARPGTLARTLVWSTTGYTLSCLVYRAFSPELFSAGLHFLIALLVVMSSVSVCLQVRPFVAGLTLALMLFLYSVPLLEGLITHTLSGGPLLLELSTELMLTSVLALIFSSSWTQLALGQSEATSQQMEYLSRTDHLTGLCNRRSLYGSIEALMREVLGASTEAAHIPDDRSGGPERPTLTFTLMLLDIDHFKSVNDTYGHASGDTVLCSVAEVLRSFVRQRDLAGRWGGEEFVLVLPGVSLEQGARVADRLREQVAGARVLPGRAVTASFGVTCWQAGDTLEVLMARADAAMYRAKQAGRNRVVVAEAHSGISAAEA
jgi:diguanylate cyclase